MNREVHVRFCERFRGEIPLYLLDLFTSCSKKVQTETEIDDASILKGTKYISTHVWIRDWKGKPLSLEYWRVDECKALEVDSVLKIHKKESSIIHKACLNYR